MPLDAFGQSGALFLVLRNLLLQLFDLRTQLIVVLEEGEVGVLAKLTFRKSSNDSGLKTVSDS